MAEQCTFWTVRYVPDAVRGDFVTIGIVLFRNVPNRLLGVRWTQHWWLVRLLDPDADLEMVRAMCSDLSQGLSDGFYDMQRLGADLAGILQLSSPAAYSVEDTASALDELQATYLERKGGRARIISAVEESVALLQSVQTLEGSEKEHLQTVLGDELAHLDVKVAS